jgi:hypothetical protein
MVSASRAHVCPVPGPLTMIVVIDLEGDGGFDGVYPIGITGAW